MQYLKKIHKLALYEFIPNALSYSISLVRYFGYFCPIWLMRIFSRTKSRIRQEPSVFFFVFCLRKIVVERPWNLFYKYTRRKMSVFFVGNNFALLVFIYAPKYIHTLCSAVFSLYHQGSLSMDIKAKFSAIKAPVQVIKRTNPWPWLKKVG